MLHQIIKVWHITSLYTTGCKDNGIIKYDLANPQFLRAYFSNKKIIDKL